MPFYSPLRYPGGKRRLSNFIKLVLLHNDLVGGEYVEPYAGGASVALALLFDEYAHHIYINDLDQSIYAFWHSVLNDTESLCRLIKDTPVSMEQWKQRKNILADHNSSLLELGFSAFFLNRTNRSGIISGGVIGGKGQTGDWKLDARYNKIELISRIEKIARHRHRITLSNLDALTLLEQISPQLHSRTLIFLDPPYYIKGQQLLYTNFYEPHHHSLVANTIQSTLHKWVVSYDDVAQIRELYSGFSIINYGLNYSAQDRYRGSEVMFFSSNLVIPDVYDPAKIQNKTLIDFLL